MKTLLNVIAVTVFAVMGARADVISIVFDNPGQTGAPGATLHYFGVLTNTDMNSNDEPVYLNFDSLNFGLSDATVVDNFGGVPLSLAPGASSGSIDLSISRLPIQRPSRSESIPAHTCFSGEWTAALSRLRMTWGKRISRRLLRPSRGIWGCWGWFRWRCGGGVGGALRALGGPEAYPYIT